MIGTNHWPASLVFSGLEDKIEEFVSKEAAIVYNLLMKTEGFYQFPPVKDRPVTFVPLINFGNWCDQYE